MRFLAVPNWSIPAAGSISGKSPELVLEEARLAVLGLGVRVHFWGYDRDHARAVTAFSGVTGQMEAAIVSIAERILPEVTLESHEGVHPRVGVLDVCPFVSLLPAEASVEEHLAERAILVDASRRLAADFSSSFRIPTRLYEYAANPEFPFALPVLRSAKAKLPPPDFGSEFVGTGRHLRNGFSIFGVRNFLIAANINIDTEDPLLSLEIARVIRQARESGDIRFRGVRALGLELPSVGQTQVSLNLTEPDHTSFDEVYQFVHDYSQQRARSITRTELIGVIRRGDLEKSTHLEVAEAQIVD